MRGKNTLKITVAVLISVGLFLFLGSAFSQETKPAERIEVTPPEEASPSSPVESKEKATEKLAEIKLILSVPLPAFWGAS